jgi:hypothetical protein
VHQNLPNTTNTSTPYVVNARIQHRSGIKTATIYYATNVNGPFSMASMTLSSGNTWTGNIPAYPSGTRVYYYIEGQSNTGKKQVRPMPAPKGNFTFLVYGNATGLSENEPMLKITPAYQNPSKGITCIPLYCNKNLNGTIKLLDIAGKEIQTIYEGPMEAGEKNYFINTTDLSSGAYLIAVQTDEGRIVQKLMVR